MQVRSLGWEDPLEEEMATYSSILAWRIPWTEEPGSYSPWDSKELDKTERLSLWELSVTLNLILIFRYNLLRIELPRYYMVVTLEFQVLSTS